MKDFTHINKSGNPHIVDIGKKETLRVAIAKGTVKMKPETLEQIKLKTFKKGDVLSVLNCQVLWHKINKSNHTIMSSYIH